MRLERAPGIVLDTVLICGRAVRRAAIQGPSFGDDKSPSGLQM